MFEDSLPFSGVQPRSVVLRLSSLAAIAMQASVAAFLVIAPLFHPLRLALSTPTPPLFMPPPREAPRQPARVRVSIGNAPTAAPSIPQPAPAPSPLRSLSLTPAPQPAASLSPFWTSSATGPVLPALLGGGAQGVRVTAAIGGAAGAAHRGPVRVSSGVSAGLLLAPIRPVYPEIAKAARVEGTVLVTAVISRDGTVTQARVTAGPPMLAQAALQAVRTAHYRPFRLNSEPTEVETTFSIVFRLGAL